MGKTMVQRQHEERMKYFDAGMETGEQYAADCFAFAMGRLESANRKSQRYLRPRIVTNVKTVPLWTQDRTTTMIATGSVRGSMTV